MAVQLDHVTPDFPYIRSGPYINHVHQHVHHLCVSFVNA